MTRSFVIWGCAGHAKVLVSLISSQGGQVVAFFDNRQVSSLLPGVPIFFGKRDSMRGLKIGKACQA